MGDYMLIPLSKGRHAKVSPEDYERLSKYSWHYHPGRFGKGYARGGPGKGRVMMHRFILNAPKDIQVDHANHDPLDNRRSNIRPCTHRQNIQNLSRVRGDLPKGVSLWAPSRRFAANYAPGFTRYRTRITVNGRRIHVGTYRTVEEAARAYDDAAKKHFGEFAFLNYPNDH